MRNTKPKPKKRNDTSHKPVKNLKEKERIKKANTTIQKTGVYKGLQYDSLGEYYTLCYLFELKDAGYILSISRAPSFLLSEGVSNNYVQQLKRGSKPMVQSIMNGHSYTPDFLISWSSTAIGKFIWELGCNKKHDKHLIISHKGEADNYITYIEVKPSFGDWHGKTSKAVADIKWVYQKYGIFISIFKPEDKFKQTFTPLQYLSTPAGGVRKMKYQPKTLKEYLNI